MDFDASSNPRNRAKNRVFPKAFEFSHRKCPSLLSSSSSNSSSSSQYFPDDSSSRSPLSPSTPLRFSSGVPFSWEKLPGIPKARQTTCKRIDSASSLKLGSLLPPPPSVTPRKHGNPGEGSFRKKSSPEWDPFVAALVECSKDDDHHHLHDHEEEVSGTLWTGAKITRSISDRFRLIGLYASCKRACAVEESIVYVPRPGRTVTTSTTYGLIQYHHR